jgi:hypothetical protein
MSVLRAHEMEELAKDAAKPQQVLFTKSDEDAVLKRALRTIAKNKG